VHTRSHAIGPRGARFAASAIARAAIACLLLVAGCAAPRAVAEPPAGARPDPAPASSSPGPAARVVVLELRLRRAAELVDDRGALRVFDQDLTVEYRPGGKGAGLDAGEVTFDGRPFQRIVGGKGGVTYRLGRIEESGGTEMGTDPWGTIANTGAPDVAAAAVRAKLAPYPVVTRPAPGQAVLRSEELPVVMLPPVPDVWYRVSITGAGDPVNAIDLGEGRWLFTRGSLEKLTTGRARLLIEVETTCGDCPGSGPMRARWSTRTELELAITLL